MPAGAARPRARPLTPARAQLSLQAANPQLVSITNGQTFPAAHDYVETCTELLAHREFMKPLSLRDSFDILSSLMHAPVHPYLALTLHR